jgi:hypothetical protein
MPAIQLYTGDLLKEGSFTCLSLAAQGLWVRMLLIMHDSCKRGFLLNAKGMQMTCKQLARIVGATEAEISQLVSEMEDAGTFSRDADATIYNRRMVREEGGKASIHQVRSEAARKRWRGQEPCKEDANGTCKSDANDAASSSSSSSTASSSSASAELLMQNGDANPERPWPPPEPYRWERTIRAMCDFFDDVTTGIVDRVASEALRVKPTATDSEIAQAVRATYKRKQESPGLWLQTVPAFLRNGAPKSREYHQPACPTCQDSGRVLRPGVTEKPGWVELPESELYEPCPNCSKGDAAVA